MYTKVWIVVNRKGQVKTSKKIPTVPADSVAMQLQIELPDALFTKPKIVASITVPRESVKGEFNVSVVSRKA